MSASAGRGGYSLSDKLNFFLLIPTKQGASEVTRMQPKRPPV
jgi:hypothetical protein